ncbi:18580_t:CDS:2 [Entrophospora sp. SA101]|nr:18580_t:CDS:2 [Entrophospora sp. SA101]
MSRTQQKLWLQRQYYQEDNENCLKHPKNQARLTKVTERINREHGAITLYRDPMVESLHRVFNRYAQEHPEVLEDDFGVGYEDAKEWHLVSDGRKKLDNSAHSILIPQWVLEHRKKQNIKDELSRKQRLNERLKKIREKEKLEREKSQSQRSRHARKRLKPIKGSEDKNYKNLNVNNTNKDIGDDDPGLNVFLVEDYDSDEDTENHSNDINDINDGIVTVVEDNLSEDVSRRQRC